MIFHSVLCQKTTLLDPVCKRKIVCFFRDTQISELFLCNLFGNYKSTSKRESTLLLYNCKCISCSCLFFSYIYFEYFLVDFFLSNHDLSILYIYPMTLDAIIVKTMNSQNMKMHANAIMSFCMYRCIPLLLCLHHLQKTLSRQGFFFYC